ncbi:hypothetical protein D3C87_1697830 [compost metagenome]
MHEAVVAQIDAHVGVAAAHSVEEDQVAGLQFVLVDGDALLGDLGGVAGKLEAQRTLGRIGDQAAAVKSGIGGVAAEAVADAQVIQGFADHGVVGVDARVGSLALALEFLYHQESDGIIGGGNPFHLVRINLGRMGG